MDEHRALSEAEKVVSEKEKMLSGRLYDPLDPILVSERQRARSLLALLNQTGEDELERRRELATALFGIPTDVSIQPPFYCDYGTNISLGTGVFFNFNCVVLDVARVSIGDRTLFGPAVQIYAATHPMTAEERQLGLELGEPIAIGADVWVGGGAIICPGVSIGDGSVIGAGSVVTREIPPGVFAAGNPCRVVRSL